MRFLWCVIGAAAFVSASAYSYESNWKRIEADNGTAFAIDLGSIVHLTDGSAMVAVCVVDADACPPQNMTRLLFDCRGHFRDLDRGGGTQLVAPRSIAGRYAAIACEGAKDSRFDPQPKVPTSTSQYCAGFSADACTRIKKMVEENPAFCRPGFARVGSGLNPEQLRACYVLSR